MLPRRIPPGGVDWPTCTSGRIKERMSRWRSSGFRTGPRTAQKSIAYAPFAHIQLQWLNLFVKLFCREALVWRQLRHLNVLSFIGIDRDTFESTACICMMSPWMARGTIIEYAKSPSFCPDVDRERLVRTHVFLLHKFLMLAIPAERGRTRCLLLAL